MKGLINSVKNKMRSPGWLECVRPASESSFDAWSNAAIWVPAAADVKSWYSTRHAAAAAAVAVDCRMR